MAIQSSKAGEPAAVAKVRNADALIDNGLSLADRVYIYITEQISDGALRGGDVILESRLAEKLDLSRTPIRDALGRLEGEGLLVRSERALTVRKVTVKEFMDMLFIRRLVEPEAARLACGQIPTADLLELRDRVDRNDWNAVDSRRWTLDEEIHLRIANAVHNDYMGELVRHLRRRTLLFEMIEFPGQIKSGREEHLRLIDALIENDPMKARQAMQDHLDSLRDGVIEQLRSY
ncbi:MAG TPA: GntR family transcriptional regulator [Rhizobium sp.]